MGMTITHNGEEYPITSDTTAAELKEEIGLDDDHRLSFRGDNGAETLNEDDVIADHVDEGQEISTIPVNGGRMFG